MGDESDAADGGDSHCVDLVHNREFTHGMPAMATQPD
jgi:hypothetical protein